MRSFGALCSVEQFFTDVSRKPIGPIFEVQAIQKDCLTLEVEKDGLHRNLVNVLGCSAA
jgi:hypothetical protein